MGMLTTPKPQQYPTVSMLLHPEAPLSPLPGWGGGMGIASGSWPCPLLATAKLNPVLEPGQEGKRILNKIQIFVCFFCCTHTHHYPSTSFFDC